MSALSRGTVRDLIRAGRSAGECGYLAEMPSDGSAAWDYAVESGDWVGLDLAACEPVFKAAYRERYAKREVEAYLYLGERA